MQDHFNKLVQVCFYGIIIFVGAVALGSKMGQVGPVLIFGLILFAFKNESALAEVEHFG